MKTATDHQVIPQGIFPQSWHIEAENREELVFLGSKNLESLKRYWRQKERYLAELIKSTQETSDILSGKTIEELKQIAKEYEYPDFPLIGVPEDSLCKEPRPLDPKSMHRQSGSTTFNCCGWCKYCGESKVRVGNCHIVTSCTLNPKWHKNVDLRFDSHCLIANGTQDFLEDCVKYMESCMAKLKSTKKEVGDYVRYLIGAMKQSEEKPCLPECRPLDWFQSGNTVVCFIPTKFTNSTKGGEFATGKVVGYLTCHNTISVRTDEEINPDGHRDGHGFDTGAARPEIMHEWEFDYLMAHPDYLEVWLKASTYLSDFEVDNMRKAFQKRSKVI